LPGKLRPTVYIPNFNGGERLARALASLRVQTRAVDVVVVDNGSADGSSQRVREEFPEVGLLELGRNLGFGPALNRAIAERPGDPILLLNNDAECEPRFAEAMLEAAGSGAEMVAGVLLKEEAPGTIDSAGVVADRTLMGFDHLHGEPVAALAGAADPLGPTGGAALYRREAFEAVGGFDERIFLYYEDLDLALRLAAAGARCHLAGEARALHAYSASLGAASGEKYARTGWSRGYMLRRYGVMARPGTALRALACEAAICAGQLAKDRTTKGIGGRLRGWRDGAGLTRREVGGVPLLDISAREALALRRRRRG
jgi:N-acetylglucosaminyl-diphospho-decaprenol L-rhamnosyltransferase